VAIWRLSAARAPAWHFQKQSHNRIRGADRRVVGALHVACRLLCGGVFVTAGAAKAFNYQAMLVAVDAYELLPAGLVGPVSAALPWAELAVGAALLAGYALRVAAGTAGVALIGFLIALGQAKARGLAIDCGCFGAGGPGDGVSWWVIIRDIPLLVAAGWLWHRPDGPFSLDAALARRHPTQLEERS
jgi:uncharacterized membrane protein YphA (DoxX/SURF4 family)